MATVIDAKWVYAWKTDEHGWVVKIVARGFKQREGIDFREAFTPTVSSSCVRFLNTIACQCHSDSCHFDADQAFVESDLEEDVFLRLPEGCGDLSGKIVRLNKSLYGSKQASRMWHAHLITGLKSLGFERCKADVCVFRLIEDDFFAVGRKERCYSFL